MALVAAEMAAASALGVLGELVRAALMLPDRLVPLALAERVALVRLQVDRVGLASLVVAGETVPVRLQALPAAVLS